MIQIKRALLSVSDKTNLIPLAETLRSYGCEIISTGGTAKVLLEAGIEVTDISLITKNPEAFSGRMKTISFTVESAILFDRDKDRQEAEALNIQAIDMVVCNFYPFEKILQQEADIDKLIENIDIGGPTMVRSAAKNFKYVTAVTDPSDYTTVIDELKENKGNIDLKLRKTLMSKAFNYTADYDAMIATNMDKLEDKHSIRLSFSEGQELRYGENSHQKAFLFKETKASESLYDMNILNGKQLSFNNLMDINSSIDAVRDLNRQGCCVIKHNTPCGLAESDNQLSAFDLAWRADAISAFGSVIAFNQEVNLTTVQYLKLDHIDRSHRKFIEVIVAPAFTKEAVEALSVNKNLRVVECALQPTLKERDLRYFKGTLLVQETDHQLVNHFNFMTNSASKGFDQGLMEFGVKAVRQVKSNAIVIVRKMSEGNFQMLGMGAGQPNRLTSVSLAIDKSRMNLIEEFQGKDEYLEQHIQEELSKTLLISEAFFPFSDSITLCANFGIKNILQPGGSIRDDEIINCCNYLGVNMIFTGLRHFKH